VSFDDDSEVLQHGGVKGGEGGRLIKEEEGRRVSSPEEGGTAGVAALQPNSDEGRGGSGARAPSRQGRGVKGGLFSDGQSWERKGTGGHSGDGRAL
jgi:hypothetical protein